MPVTDAAAPRTGMATVLFTDTVDSTRLRWQIGDAAADELRRVHDRLLDDAVTTHNGTVIKHLGDGAMATFSGAADAVSAAVAIQQRIHTHNRQARGPALAIRVGISAGDVTWENGDCFGVPVIEAARLCAAATGTQIVVAESVRMMARGRHGAQLFTSVGLLDLKGLPEPVPACTVLWEPAPDDTAGRIPLPALLARTEQFRFAGRDHELASMTRVWRETAAAGLRLMLVGGEPGIGKTRLAAETARIAHAAGAAVLFGRCDEELGLPFQPFVEALQHFLRHAAPSQLCDQLGLYPGELVRLVPEIAGTLPNLAPPLQSDAETERYRMFDAVASWLAAAAQAQPLVLVLDDIHWAGKPTLLLLKHLLHSSELVEVEPGEGTPTPPLRTGRRAQLLIVATYRDTEVSQPNPLAEFLPDLRRESGVERLTLSGLDSAGVTALIELTANQRLDEPARALVRALQEETEGNPFFIGEVIRHLAESGALVRRDGAWELTADLFKIGIPDGVREVIGRRLGRLSPATNDTLRRAAVMGRDFDLGVLGGVSDLREADLLAAMDQAVAARLVDETGFETYRFAHSLVRSTLYEQVSATRRVRWHRAIAEALARRRPDDVTALAYHYNQAAVGGNVDKAIEYAMRAGDQANARLAFDQALVFYRQALELLDSIGDPDARQRCVLLIRLGQAQRDSGDIAHRATLLEVAALAQRAGYSDALVQAALANNRGWAATTGLVDAERVAVLEAALAAVAETDSDARARLLATLASELGFAPDWQRRRALSDDALAMARRLDVPTTLAHVLRLHFVAVLAPDTLAERRANSSEHLELASRLDDPLSSYWGHWQGLWVALESADIDAVDRSLERAERMANQTGIPQLTSVIAMQLSWRAWLAGRLADAEEHANRQLALGQTYAVPECLAVFGAQLWMIRWAQGRLAEIEPLVAQAAAMTPHLPGLRAALGVLYCEIGRDAEAAALLGGDAASAFSTFPYDQFWLVNMTANARVYCHLDDPGPCQTLYDLLAPWHEQVAFQGAICTGPVSKYLGRLATTLGRFDAAERHFAAAVAQAERLRAPILLAYTRLAWARLCVRRGQVGDLGQARQLLDQCLTAAAEYGLGGVDRQARDMLAGVSD